MSFRAFYGRKSRLLGDAEDIDVFAHQLNPLIRRAEAEGRAVAASEVVVEVGSSESIEERPRFREIVQALEALPPGSGGELWVADVDRLSRGTMAERGRIAEALCRGHVLLRTATRTLDLTDPDDEMWYEWTSSRGRNELGRYKQRTADRRRELVLAGEPRTGRVPWGYRWNKNPRPDGNSRRGHMEPHPDRFPVLKVLCREALATSTRMLGLRYAAHGLHQQIVLGTLRNPVICGWAPQRYFGDGKRPSPRNQWLWPTRAGYWEPACTRLEWEAIQQALDRRRDERTKWGGDAGWCRDVLRFAGHPERVRLGSRPPVPHYELALPGQPKLYIPRAQVHAAVTEAISRLLSRPESLADALARYTSHTGPDNGSDAATEALLAAIETKQSELDRLQLLELREEDEERRAGWRRVGVGLAAELRDLRARLQAVAPVVAPALPPASVAETLDALGPAFAGLWESDALDDGERRALVNALFARVEVTVTPGRGNRGWRREVTSLEWQPWVGAE